MKIVQCSYAAHATQILEIFNHAILNSTALYDYRPRPLARMTTWFETKAAHAFPVIGAESDQAELLGFVTYGTFRDWPAYQYSVEHSVYVKAEHRGRGIGKVLMKEIIAAACQAERHVLIGGIDAENSASIALHRQFGFQHAGTIKHAGFKFGRWLDLAFYQLILDTPRAPKENCSL